MKMNRNTFVNKIVKIHYFMIKGSKNHFYYLIEILY